MAIILEANYSKKLGLPVYSSHQFSVTIRTEVVDLTQVEAASARLYALLQASVDQEIQKVGFLPTKETGDKNGDDVNGHRLPSGNEHQEVSICSPRQLRYIEELAEKNHLSRNQLDALAQGIFGKSVRALNKVEASELIDDLKAQASDGEECNIWTMRPPRQH